MGNIFDRIGIEPAQPAEDEEVGDGCGRGLTHDEVNEWVDSIVAQHVATENTETYGRSGPTEDALDSV